MEEIYLTIDNGFVIHPHGYFITPYNKSNHYEDGFLDSLTWFFKKNGSTVVDFGCGDGYVVNRLLANSINAVGFDGNPFTNQISMGLCGIYDLIEVKKFEENFDWVICLEVGQHIPPQYEEKFIETLDKNNSRGIIISWAPESRGGIAHVNCRNNDYVRNIFSYLGYYNDIDTELNMRSNMDKSSPLIDSLMVFTKDL